MLCSTEMILCLTGEGCEGEARCEDGAGEISEPSSHSFVLSSSINKTSFFSCFIIHSLIHLNKSNELIQSNQVNLTDSFESVILDSSNNQCNSWRSREQQAGKRKMEFLLQHLNQTRWVKSSSAYFSPVAFKIFLGHRFRWRYPPCKLL